MQDPLAQLDLESIEALLKANNTNHTNDNDDYKKKKKENRKEDDDDDDDDNDVDDHKKRKYQSRSHSISHKKKYKRKSHDRSGSRSRRRSRSRSDSKRRINKRDDNNNDKDYEREKERRDKDRERDNNNKDREKRIKDDIKYLEEQKLKEEKEVNEKKQKEIETKLEEARRQLEEAKRDDCTVLISNLSIKTGEKEIYQFFQKYECGRIRDIRIIKDQKTGRSKGVAYVEFYMIDSVNRAISQSGKDLNGNIIRIQPSQAEKNRAAAVAKNLRQARNPVQQSLTNTRAMRIYVGGLTEQLASITENDLRDLFNPFGDIEFVDLHRDPQTGKCKGYAFIQYKNAADAKAAIQKMNGFLINGKPIKVSTVESGVNNTPGGVDYSLDLDEESGANFLHNAQSRALLMQKLTRETPQVSINPMASLGIGLPGLGIPNFPILPGVTTPLTSLINPIKLPTMTMTTTTTTTMTTITQPTHQGIGNLPTVASNPTTAIILVNMFNPNEVDLIKEPGFYVDLREEVEEECKNYGDVENVIIDQKSLEGHIYVKFSSIQSAQNAIQALNNRYFSGKKIISYFIPESIIYAKLR